MLSAILQGLIIFIAIIVAVRVLYVLVVVAGMLIASLVRCFGTLLLGITRVIFEILALPFRLMAVLLRPILPAEPGLVGAASGMMLGSLCRNRTCRCANPARARFCRRCGAVLASGQGVMV